MNKREAYLRCGYTAKAARYEGVIRATEYKGVTIIAHPTNPHRRWAWRGLDGRIQYARSLRCAKLSIDSEYRVQDRIMADASKQ